MTNPVNRGRQEVLALEQEFDFTDLTVATSLVTAKLPVNAIVLRGAVHVETAFNGTTPTLAVGKVGATTQYVAAASLATVGVVALTAGFGIKATGEKVILTPSQTASTAGKGRLVIEYLIAGRAGENQP